MLGARSGMFKLFKDRYDADGVKATSCNSGTKPAVISWGSACE
jgi:hypothetical protein